MTSYLPTLKQLQYLVALQDHGHFGRAAEACFVTQSTLSAGLRELEMLLGVTLVERTRRVVRFTPLGESIADKARRVLREADVERAADAMREELTGVLERPGHALQWWFASDPSLAGPEVRRNTADARAVAAQIGLGLAPIFAERERRLPAIMRWEA